jgi:hypothetical protein
VSSESPGISGSRIGVDEMTFNNWAYIYLGMGEEDPAVEQPRLVCIELQMAPTRTAVHIGMEPFLGVRREGEKLSDLDFLNKSAAVMLDELAWWTPTLKAGRVEEATIAKLVGAAR